MLVSELESSLLTAFPREDAEGWDRVGLSVGDPCAEVRGVACALDATPRNLAEAQSLGANVLITHHPIYLEPPASLAPPSRSTPLSAGAIWEAVRKRVSVISLHTNLDRSVRARRLQAGLLGLEASSSLEHPTRPDLSGIGALCEAGDMDLEELASRAERAFGAHALVWGAPGARVGRVAVVGGSIGDFGELALRSGCDTVVGGELGYHRALDLSSRGLSIVLLSHGGSEQPFCRILAEAAAETGVASNLIRVIPLPPQWRPTSQGGHL